MCSRYSSYEPSDERKHHRNEGKQILHIDHIRIVKTNYDGNEYQTVVYELLGVLWRVLKLVIDLFEIGDQSEAVKGWFRGVDQLFCQVGVLFQELAS